MSPQPRLRCYSYILGMERRRVELRAASSSHPKARSSLGCLLAATQDCKLRQSFLCPWSFSQLTRRPGYISWYACHRTHPKKNLSLSPFYPFHSRVVLAHHHKPVYESRLSTLGTASRLKHCKVNLEQLLQRPPRAYKTRIVRILRGYSCCVGLCLSTEPRCGSMALWATIMGSLLASPHRTSLSRSPPKMPIIILALLISSTAPPYPPEERISQTCLSRLSRVLHLPRAFAD